MSNITDKDKRKPTGCKEKDFKNIPHSEASKYCGFGWCYGCKFK